jgi:hypothetical protein
MATGECPYSAQETSLMPYRLSSIYYPNGNPDLEDNVLQMVQHWHR